MGLSDELIEMLLSVPTNKVRDTENGSWSTPSTKTHPQSGCKRAERTSLPIYQHMDSKWPADETDPMGKPFPILHLQLPTPPQITQIEHRL